MASIPVRGLPARPLAGHVLRRILSGRQHVGLADVLAQEVAILSLPYRELRRLRYALAGHMDPDAYAACGAWLYVPPAEPVEPGPPRTAAELVWNVRRTASALGWRPEAAGGDGAPLPRAAVHGHLADLDRLAQAERAAAAGILQGLSAWPADDLLHAARAGRPAAAPRPRREPPPEDAWEPELQPVE